MHLIKIKTQNLKFKRKKKKKFKKKHENKIKKIKWIKNIGKESEGIIY